MFFLSVCCALERVEDAVREENAVKLLQALQTPFLALKVRSRSLSERKSYGNFNCLATLFLHIYLLKL